MGEKRQDFWMEDDVLSPEQDVWEILTSNNHSESSSSVSSSPEHFECE